MTTIRLDNGSTSQVNKFYIQFEGTSIKGVIEKTNMPISISKTPSKWIEGPDKINLDLLNINNTYIIQGIIDEKTNKTAGWADADLNDARQVIDRIEYMITHGGVLKLTLGLSADGYTADPTLTWADAGIGRGGASGTRELSLAITRFQFEEVPQDYDPDGTGKHIAPHYAVILEGFETINR